MGRFTFAVFVMLALTGAAAAAEDHGPLLAALFAKTCATRPSLPSELRVTAIVLGFSGDAIPAELEAGPSIDIVYSARWAKSGENVSLLAYFSGPIDEPTVSCSLNTTGVSADALPSLIEKSMDARDRTEKLAKDGNQLLASWRTGPAGSDNTLDMSAWRTLPKRASINITYHGNKK